MGILDSFKNLARPYDENDMYLDDEEFPEEEFPEPEETPASSGTAAPGGAPKAAAPRTESTTQSFTTGAGASAFTAQRESRVMNINTTAQLQVVIVKPEKFDAAAEIADHLRERRTVVMNLEKTNKDIARRLIDFLSGVAYALDGKIKKVAVNTFIITPYNVGLMGDLLDELENNGLYL